MKIALVFCRIDNMFSSCRAGVFSIFESNPPLGLAAIGTVVKQKGHEVKIFDQHLKNYSNIELISELIKYSPQIIGFSCTSLNISNSIECAKKLKRQLPDIIQVAGGIHVTLCASEIHALKLFDYIVKGEGEEVFDEIVDSVYNDRHNILKENGIWDIKCEDEPKTATLSTIDQPIIDRTIFEYDSYKNAGALLNEKPCYSIFSSRGCPFKCSFCSKPEYFKLYRVRSIDNVISEICLLVNKYGAKAVSFREDNFTVNLDRLLQFCDAMISHFDGQLPWECESRANLPKYVLERMYNAGCRGIWCGVETVVPKWSQWINKQLEKEDVDRFYADCYDIGIKTGALFMFGFPYQTEEELSIDIEYAKQLPTVFSAFQCLAIFPGSPLMDFYKEHQELLYQVSSHTSLALTEGKTFEDMIKTEAMINQLIRSNRNRVHNE